MNTQPWLSVRLRTKLVLGSSPVAVTSSFYPFKEMQNFKYNYSMESSKCCTWSQNTTLNHLRKMGIWIVNVNAMVQYLIYHMLQIERKDGSSKMAHLPPEICTEAVQFTYCGVDMFGSLIIKEKIRNQTLNCPFHLFLQIYSTNWSHQFTWCWFLYHVKERSSLFNMVKQWSKFYWCLQWIEKGI